MRRNESGKNRQAEGCIALSSAEAVSKASGLPPAELRADQRAVILHRKSRGGIPLRIAVPLEHYCGVSADIRYTQNEGLSCEIVLAHANAEFEVTLFSAKDDENILAEWNAWSRRLNMPLMIRTEHGDVMARPKFGPLEISAVSPRRARNLFLIRRPRFLRARKAATLADARLIHQEREIIARN